MSDSKILLTYKEAAEILKIKPITLRRWVMEKKIPFLKLGIKSVRFLPEHLESVLHEVPAGGTK